MILDRAGQSALLRLSQVDLLIQQIKNEISKAVNSKELQDLTEKLAAASSELLTSRTDYENLDMEARKADDNLHLVEQRIARDEERLKVTTSSKDAQAMQSEVQSLNARKGELEEIELEILDRLELSKKEFDGAASKREDVQLALNTLQAEIQLQIDELKTNGRKLTADREILISKIPAEILVKYNALAVKQIAVGQVENRSCTACRMGLTASTIDSLSSLEDDAIGNCPECLAMIVR